MRCNAQLMTNRVPMFQGSDLKLQLPALWQRVALMQGVAVRGAGAVAYAHTTEHLQHMHTTPPCETRSTRHALLQLRSLLAHAR